MVLLRAGEVTGSQFDPVVSEPTRIPFKAIKKNPTAENMMGFVLEGVTMVIVAPAEPVITERDSVEIAGEKYSVVKIVNVEPGDVTLIQRAFLAK